MPSLPLAVLFGAALSLAPAAKAPTPAARPVAVVPFELYDGRVFLRVQVGGMGPGRPAEITPAGEFQFDSAAGRSCVSRSFGQRIRLETPLTASVSGAGDGFQTVQLAQDVPFAVGPLAFRAERVPLIDLDDITRYTGRRTDGLVGRDFLERYVVAFDFEARTMTAWEPSGFEYRGTGTVLPVETLMGGPVVQAVVRMPGRPPLAAKILLDAPHAGPVVLTTPFVDRHDLLESARQLTPKLLESVVVGVGGESAQLVGRSLSLDIGPFSFASPVVSFSRAKAGALASTEIDGLIGSRIMNRFRIIYDCPRRRVILEPGPRLAEPFTHDMSGLRMRAQTLTLETIEIVRVAEGSAAAAAGVQKGDLVVSVNGRSVRAVDLQEIRALFERAGRARLDVRRDGEVKTIVLELRPRV